MAMSLDDIAKHYASQNESPEDQETQDTAQPEQEEADNEAEPVNSAEVQTPEETSEDSPLEQEDLKDVKITLPSSVTGAPARAETPAQHRMAMFDQQNSALQAAADARNKEVLINQLGKAGAMIGGGLSGVVPMGKVQQPNTSIFDQNIQLADRHVNDLRAQQDMAGKEAQRQQLQAEADEEDKLNDPDSDISAAARAGFESASGKKLGADVTANDLKGIGLNLTSLVNTQELMKARQEASELKSQRAQDQQQQTSTNQENTRFSQMNNKAIAELASSRSALGRSALVKQDAEKIQAMVQGRNLNDLDNREIAELAITLNRVLSQGQPTVSGTEHLIPQTAQGSAAKIEEYLLNERQSADAGSFVKQMMSTVGREHDLAMKQMNATKQQIFGGYSDLQQKNPERYNQIMQNHGLGENTPTAQTIAAPQGLITIRRKSDGASKTLSAQDAAKYLNSPDFEQVQ